MPQAVEAGEVPANLLAEPRAEIQGSRTNPPEQSRADTVRDVVVVLQVPIEKVDATLAALEAQPRVVRELFPLRRTGAPPANSTALLLLAPA